MRQNDAQVSHIRDDRYAPYVIGDAEVEEGAR
jgi:hypothetical protein